MSRLEDLKPNASIQGILPNGLVTVVSVRWCGSEALELATEDCGRHFVRFIANDEIVSFTAPVLAVETFYVIFDNTMKGCTIVTTEPTDKARYKILGKYTSNAEAEKAIASMKEC